MDQQAFTRLLERMNADNRTPGGCTPAVCRAAEEGADVLMWINAVCGFETAGRKDEAGTYTNAGRLARPDDFNAVAERAKALRAAVAQPSG